MAVGRLVVVVRGRRAQYGAAFIAMLGMVCGGLHMGWASPALPKLLAGDPGFTVTRDDASWIVSMLLLGSTIGCLIARSCVDRIGRKTTMLLAAGPYATAWLMIMLAPSGDCLYAAQLLAGTGLGIGLVVISMYCGEIAEDGVRGALSSSLNFGMNIGSLISYVIGPNLSYKEVAYVSLVFPVLFFISGLTLPESPCFYLMKGQKDKALEVLMMLRDADESNVSILATILTDKLGRKPLLYSSFIGLSLSLTAIGSYFFVQDYLEVTQEVTSSISWIPLVSVMIFCVSYSTGIGSLGYVMLAELFPTNIKSIAVGCGSIYGSLWAFTVSKVYLVVADSSGIYVAFWIFAACCYLGILFTIFVVPETKNKSFTEIQDILNGRSDKKSIENVEAVLKF